ncbi:MAG: hypothetical protein ACYCPW_03805, partial [Nitrososphaerales archaeon]
ALIVYGLGNYDQATTPVASPSFEGNNGLMLSYFGPPSLKNVTAYLEFTPKPNTLDNFTLRAHFGGEFLANTTYTFIFSVYPFKGNISRISFTPSTNENETNDISSNLGNLPISEVDGVRSIHLSFNHELPETVIYVSTFYLNANDSVTSNYPGIASLIFTASTQQIDFKPIINTGSLILSYSDFNVVTQNHREIDFGLQYFAVGITLLTLSIPYAYNRVAEFVNTKKSSTTTPR